jgi:zinc protease
MYKKYNNVFDCILYKNNKFFKGGFVDDVDTSLINFNKIDTLIYKSKSGMRLICIPNGEATVVSMGIYIRVGSLDEKDNELGVAHFLEHMTFKGTGKYPDNKLVERLDNLGTTYNAATSYEYTNYYIHGLPQFQNELITMLLDMYFDPQIPPQTVETEKKVILEEYKMRNDSKSIKQYMNLLNLVTKEKNKLYNRPVIGTKTSIESITIDDLNKFREKYHDHNKTTITISGKFDVDKMKPLIEKIIKEYDSNFGSFERYDGLEKINQKLFKTDLILSTSKPKLSNRFIYSKIDGEQTNITLNFPCWKSFTKNNIYLGILSVILSNRLYKTIRIDNGLVYNVDTNMHIFDTFGIFSIYMGVDYDNIYDAIRLTLDELIKIYEYGILEEELLKVKNLNLTGMMIDYQNQLTLFNIYTGNIAYNYTYYTPNDIIDIFNNVDSNRVNNNIIKEIINPKQLYISMIGSKRPINIKMKKLFNYFNKKIRKITKKIDK